MNQGIRTVVYPVRDTARAKAYFRELLGVEPSTDAAYYVGFKVGNQEIGGLIASVRDADGNIVGLIQ